MAGEIYVAMEGDLRWVTHSGNQNSWATASAPTSGVFGFVEGFSFGSAQEIATINERGNPNHLKRISKAAITLKVNFLTTGYMLASALQNNTLEQFNLEFKSRNSAQGSNAGTGRFYQFHGMAMQSNDYAENKEGNTIDIPFIGLGMVGPTASGYLSFP